MAAMVRLFQSLYPTEIRATANNFIMNIGRAVGGFSSVIIGFLLDKYSLMIVVVFLSLIYIFSLVIMMTIPGIGKLKKAINICQEKNLTPQNNLL
jgi:hypothetical protein